MFWKNKFQGKVFTQSCCHYKTDFDLQISWQGIHLWIGYRIENAYACIDCILLLILNLRGTDLQPVCFERQSHNYISYKSHDIIRSLISSGQVRDCARPSASTMYFNCTLPLCYCKNCFNIVSITFVPIILNYVYAKSVRSNCWNVSSIFSINTSICELADLAGHEARLHIYSMGCSVLSLFPTHVVRVIFKWVVYNTESRLVPHIYFVYNNCEHFISYCVTNNVYTITNDFFNKTALLMTRISWVWPREVLTSDMLHEHSNKNRS